MSKTDPIGKEVNHSCLKGGWWANRGEAKLPVERNWSIRKEIIFNSFSHNYFDVKNLDVVKLE